MRITPDRVIAEYEWVREREPIVVALINETRDALGDRFGTTVASVSPTAYRDAVDTVFADGEVAVNVAGYVAILRDLDVANDYPGFVVDEVLGRALAETIAGGHPLSLLAGATFHIADIRTHGDDGDPAGVDDLDAALAAGFQTRLPGWPWRDEPSPFGIDVED